MSDELPDIYNILHEDVIERVVISELTTTMEGHTEGKFYAEPEVYEACKTLLEYWTKTCAT